MNISDYPSAADLLIQTLGACEFQSPLLGRGTPLEEPTRRILLPSDTAELAAFLRCPKVRQRTDDDVTLLLASWVG